MYPVYDFMMIIIIIIKVKGKGMQLYSASSELLHF